MSGEQNTGPNKHPLPPLLTAGVIALCLLLDWLAPIGWEEEQVTTFMRATGWLFIVVAIGIDVWAFVTFRRHQANMMPHRPATALITDGPFAHSRNPIYLANVMLTAGIGFALGSRWFLLGAAVLFFLLTELAVKREERHLAATFGDRWKDYSNAVRRWI